MKAELIRIGNSRGIRIPKPVIEQCRLGSTVELSIENERLIISSRRLARQGWANAFREANRGNNELLLDGIEPNEFERKEWRW